MGGDFVTVANPDDEKAKAVDKLITSIPDSGGEGGKADEGKGKESATPTEADTLRTRLADVQTELDKLKKAEDKRKKTELEEQGKYQELIKEQERQITELELDKLKVNRRVDLQQAVMAHETSFNKAGLIKQVDRLDAETGREKPFPELIAMAEEELKALIPDVQKTQIFGTTGGGSGAGVREQELVTLRELHKQGRDGDARAKAAFIKGRAEYKEKHGEWPKI